jgi:hypothetical protein
MDNTRRVIGRNLSDLVQDPRGYVEQTAENAANTLRNVATDPMSYVGGGLGRVKFMDRAGREVTAPTQASLSGSLHSMGMIDDAAANRIYNLGGREAADPELLRLIEDEAIRRGRIYAR